MTIEAWLPIVERSPEDLVAQALSTLQDTADDLPLAAVTQIVREDPSPDLRMQALELIVERNGEQARAEFSPFMASCQELG